MKKYGVILTAALVLGTSLHAIKSEECQSSLDELQKTYPIIKLVRQDSIFKEASQKQLGSYSSSAEVLKAALIEVIPVYLNNMSRGSYFNFVEGLDPVWKAFFGKLTIGDVKKQ